MGLDEHLPDGDDRRDARRFALRQGRGGRRARRHQPARPLSRRAFRGAALIGALLVASCHKPGLHDEVVRVHDGDTLTLASGTRIRLAGIDANEINGRCHNECAPLSAKAARDALASLVLHKAIDCEPTGQSYKRIVAWCRIGRTDLSCAQVARGAAIVWQRYDPEGRLAHCVPSHS